MPGGLGATGLTFLDDAVTFFEPASSGRWVLYLVAVSGWFIKAA